MKVYVVTCCEYEAYTNKYDKFVETSDVFILKNHAELFINEQKFTDEKLGNDYEYYISEHEV